MRRFGSYQRPIRIRRLRSTKVQCTVLDASHMARAGHPVSQGARQSLSTVWPRRGKARPALSIRDAITRAVAWRAAARRGGDFHKIGGSAPEPRGFTKKDREAAPWPRRL